MSTYAIHSKLAPGQATVAAARTGCGCPEPEPPPCGCAFCCFVRPQYFCGHLLSSEDLSLQLRYDIEKNKLRNRTLHGHGVVCGLTLACDPDCEGAILVSTGYGIDDCGNDLVVCEPTRFKVITRLREKRLIDGPPLAPEDCGKVTNSDDDECPEPRCFYIVACYAEQPYQYETPFQAGCNPQPAACQPTRIRETVSFDLLTAPPKDTSATPWGMDAPCLNAFEESELVAELRRQQKPLLAILDEPAAGQAEFDYCDLFCRLKKLFRRLVRVYPPTYTCDLAAQIDALTCPEESPNREGPRTDMRDAYCALLNLIFTYAVECVLEALAFACPTPCEPGCVLLGAVYVENGVLKRVCNTPRRYVWSFANFWNILQLELVTLALREAARRGTGDEPGTVRCCPEYQLDCKGFLGALTLSEQSFSKSVRAFPNALAAFMTATASAFDFTNASNFAPDLYTTNAATIDSLKLKVTGSATVENPAAVSPGGDMFSAFLSHALLQRGAPVVAIRSPKADQFRLMRDPTFGLGRRARRRRTSTGLASLERLNASRATIEKLSKAVTSLSDRLDASTKTRGKKDDNP